MNVPKIGDYFIQSGFVCKRSIRTRRNSNDTTFSAIDIYKSNIEPTLMISGLDYHNGDIYNPQMTAIRELSLKEILSSQYNYIQKNHIKDILIWLADNDT